MVSQRLPGYVLPARRIAPAGQTTDSGIPQKQAGTVTAQGFVPDATGTGGTGLNANVYNTVGNAIGTTGATIAAIIASNNQTEIAQLQAQTQLQIAQLQTSSQQAIAAGNLPLAQQQAQQAAALQQFNAQLALQRQQSSSNMMLIGLGVVTVLGLGALFVFAKK